MTPQQTTGIEFRVKVKATFDVEDETVAFDQLLAYPIGGHSEPVAPNAAIAQNVFGLAGDAGDWALIGSQSVPGEAPYLLKQIEHKGFKS